MNASRGEVRKYGPPAKLTINDLLKAEIDGDDTDAYVFRGIRIRVVDIMGVVTGRKLIDSRVLYTVDDGTGVINCLYDHERPVNIERRDEAFQLKTQVEKLKEDENPELVKAMQQLMSGAVNKSLSHMEVLCQGDCAHVLGFISDFHGTREIKAFQLNKVSSILDEEDRTAEIATLYNKVYYKLT